MKPNVGRVRSWLVLLSAVVAVALTTALGQWQLRRAEQKQVLVDARARQAALASIDGASLGQPGDSVAHLDSLLYRHIVLQGHWLPQHTVALDNRQMQGRPGFFVLTPLRLSSGVVVLVQRGWAPRHFDDRSALPKLDTPANEVRVQGHLAPWPSRIYDFGAVETGPMRQNLDFDAYRRQTGLPMLELSVQQSDAADAADDGLLRDWPVPASGIEKHHGYAFQWFGLSALIALLYVWFQIVQARRKT